MYCENCGHKLNVNHLFCEECGFKVNRIINNVVKNSNSNKTLWIVLGCVFGCLFLLTILGIIFFTFLIVNVSENVDTYDKYELNEYYDSDEPYYYRDDKITIEKF